MPIHPDVFGELRAQEVRNLPHIVERLLWMGISPGWIRGWPLEGIDMRVFLMADGIQTFARRINYPPWNTYLRRKEEARQWKIWLLNNTVAWDYYIGHRYPLSDADRDHIRLIEDHKREIDRLTHGWRWLS